MATYHLPIHELSVSMSRLCLSDKQLPTYSDLRKKVYSFLLLHMHSGPWGLCSVLFSLVDPKKNISSKKGS